MTFVDRCCRPKKMQVGIWFSSTAFYSSEMSVLFLLFLGSHNDSVSHTGRHIENLSFFSITFFSSLKSTASTAQVWLNKTSARFSIWVHMYERYRTQQSLQQLNLLYADSWDRNVNRNCNLSSTIHYS